MPIQINTKQLNKDPMFRNLKQKIDALNTTTTKGKSMKSRFNFDKKSIAAWHADSKINPVTPCKGDPIESYFTTANWLKVTELAKLNDFNHHNWIKNSHVKKAINDITNTYPYLKHDKLIDAIPRSHTAYHPLLADFLLKTMPVKPSFQATYDELKKRVTVRVTEFIASDIERKELRSKDRQEDKDILQELRKTRGELMQEELWEFDQDNSQTGMPFHTLAKKFDVCVQDLHEVCMNESLIERDPENTFAYKPTNKALSLGYMRALKNVKGEPTTYPWVTKKGMQHLFDTLDQLDMHGISVSTPAIQYSDKELEKQSLFN